MRLPSGSRCEGYHVGLAIQITVSMAGVADVESTIMIMSFHTHRVVEAHAGVPVDGGIMRPAYNSRASEAIVFIPRSPKAQGAGLWAVSDWV